MVLVQTVTGPVESATLGLTLPHEHVLNDARVWWHAPAEGDAEGQAIARGPLCAAYIGRLRNDPFMSFDNTQMTDETDAIAELREFVDVGGRTMLDMTCRGMGRNSEALARIAMATGLNIVSGTGYYLGPSHPPEVDGLDVGGLAAVLVRDLAVGCDGSNVRAGVIGEIGISKGFTAAERKVLRAAARAQTQARVPMFVHLPGWERLGHAVLDIVESEGVDPGATVLCHMNPSWTDQGYQRSLADRGSWLEYDMVGMDYYYADQQAQSPCDEENAQAICGLLEAGYRRLLVSSDTFLKMMLKRYGGFGYAHVPTNFAARLRRHGLREDVVRGLMEEHPRRLFETACAAAAQND